MEIFTFAFVCAVGIGLHDGHHATVCLDNDRGAGARLCGPALCWRGCLKYRSGVALGDAGNRAFTHNNAIVFNDLVHGLCKGLIGTKVGDYALQWARAGAVAHLGALDKRADSFGAVSKLRFVNADVAKGGVPAEFFLPALCTPAVFIASWEVFSTCCCAQL